MNKAIKKNKLSSVQNIVKYAKKRRFRAALAIKIVNCEKISNVMIAK